MGPFELMSFASGARGVNFAVIFVRFLTLNFQINILKNSRKYSPEILGFGLIVGLGPRILTSTVGDNSEVLISKFDFIITSKI